jgi:hypothetical protein
MDALSHMNYHSPVKFIWDDFKKLKERVKLLRDLEIIDPEEYAALTRDTFCLMLRAAIRESLSCTGGDPFISQPEVREELEEYFVHYDGVLSNLYFIQIDNKLPDALCNRYIHFDTKYRYLAAIRKVVPHPDDLDEHEGRTYNEDIVWHEVIGTDKNYLKVFRGCITKAIICLTKAEIEPGRRGEHCADAMSHLEKIEQTLGAQHMRHSRYAVMLIKEKLSNILGRDND